MGLGIAGNSKCHWSYSGFSAWRNRLAVLGGFELIDVKNEYGTFTQANIDHSKYEECNYFGKWKKNPEDALIILFAHSDCEGVIKLRQMKFLLPRIKEIYAKMCLPENMERDAWFRPNTEYFIETLEARIAEKKPMRFC
jgi:hypothetical protein